MKINSMLIKYSMLSVLLTSFSYLSAGGRPPADPPPARPAPYPAGCWVASAGRTGPVPGSYGRPGQPDLAACSEAPGSSASGPGRPHNCSGRHEILWTESALDERYSPGLPQGLHR